MNIRQSSNGALGLSLTRSHAVSAHHAAELLGQGRLGGEIGGRHLVCVFFSNCGDEGRKGKNETGVRETGGIKRGSRQKPRHQSCFPIFLGNQSTRWKVESRFARDDAARRNYHPTNVAKTSPRMRRCLQVSPQQCAQRGNRPSLEKTSLRSTVRKWG